MTSYKELLIDKSWIRYVKHFERENIVLQFPESFVFTVQLVMTRLTELVDAYERYPHAKKFKLEDLNALDWARETYVFDTNFEMIKGPKNIGDWTCARLSISCSE